jgi:cytochrome c-type biogenesis protein CcmF
MTPELGHFALAVALALALVQSVLPILGASRGDVPLMRSATATALGQVLFVGIAFAALMRAFIVSDFTVLNVASNSNSLKPMIYKVAATWGSHEGSLLLWVFILTIFGGAVAYFGSNLPTTLKARTLSVQAWISVGFLSFMLFTSNPFDRVFPPPLDGNDLNPLLQDIGLAMHPPLLYFGYVGFSIVFSFAAAALIEGRVDAAWARWVRPWTLAAWVSLTAGIALGSWWAYYELGWGGWWFWDPVENASLMPWLAGTALIHSLAVSEKRNMFRAWTVLLAIITFSLSLLGTFLVRSGVLTSVHAFANDPARGAFILGFLIVVAGGALILFGLRASALRSNTGFKPVSREAFLLGNNLILLTATSVVLMGTLFPLIGEALDMKISIRSPYFNGFFVPLAFVLILLMVPGMFSNWKRQDGNTLLKRMALLAPAAIIAGWFGSRLPEPSPWQGVLAIMLALFLVFAHVDDVVRRARAYKQGFVSGLGKLGRGYWGMVLAHCGLAVLIAGITLVSFHEVERDIRMAPGDTAKLGDYTFVFDSLDEYRGPNFDSTRGHFHVSHDGDPVAVMHPEKRTYHASRQVMTEAAIDAGFWRDLYVALGEPLDKSNAWAVRIYFKPGIRWIWLGALIMALGGALALTDKRYRRNRFATNDAGAANES